MGEVTKAREGNVNPINAQSSISSAGRRVNPFRSITTRPISETYRRELEEQGVNMRIYESLRREERNRRIDGELALQERQLRINLREKYPLANYSRLSDTDIDQTYSQAVKQRKDYNRELAQGIKRLRSQAAAAKRK